MVGESSSIMSLKKNQKYLYSHDYHKSQNLQGWHTGNVIILLDIYQLHRRIQNYGKISGGGYDVTKKSLAVEYSKDLMIFYYPDTSS